MTETEVLLAMRDLLRGNPPSGVLPANIVVVNDWEAFVAEPANFPLIALRFAGADLKGQRGTEQAKLAQRIEVVLVLPDTEAAHLASPLKTLGCRLMGRHLDPVKRIHTLALADGIEVNAVGGFVEHRLAVEVATFWQAESIQ